MHPTWKTLRVVERRIKVRQERCGLKAMPFTNHFMGWLGAVDILAVSIAASFRAKRGISRVLAGTKARRCCAPDPSPGCAGLRDDALRLPRCHKPDGFSGSTTCSRLAGAAASGARSG